MNRKLKEKTTTLFMHRININPLVGDFMTGRKAVAISLIFCGMMSNCLAIFLSLSIGTYYETIGNDHSSKGRILQLFNISLPHEPNLFFVVFLLLIIATTVLQFIFRAGSQHVALDFSFWLRKKLFRHHIRMNIGEFSKKTIGSSLLRYSGDLKSVQTYLGKGVFQFGSDVFFLALGILVLFLLHPLASIYVVAGSALGFSLMQYLSFQIRKMDDQRSDILSSSLSYIHESLQSLETIKTWNKEYSVINRFRDKTDALHLAGVRTSFWKSLHHVLPFALMFMLLLIVFFTHTKTSTKNDASFIPYILLLILLFPAIKRIMRVSATWKLGIAGLKKIGLILNQPLENEQKLEEYFPDEGKVEFRKVSFSYDNGTQAIFDRSCTWEAGRINYLQGTGKTTLVKLLIGLYKPASGMIVLDGEDSRKFSLKSIRQHIAFCSDHTRLYGNTIFKCLFLDKKDYDKEAVQNCLRLLRFSQAKDNGAFDLQQKTGRGGKFLSRADYLKLMIARTLLSGKRILIFDGIIESLELPVQQTVIAYLDQIKFEKTIVLTAKYSDRFIDNAQSMLENRIVNYDN